MKITPELRMERFDNPVQPAGAYRYMGHAYKMCIRIGGYMTAYGFHPVWGESLYFF